MIYKGKKTKNISFPLGGIGTGCIGLSGNAELVDWEIFNRPNKGTRNGYSHFAIKANYGGKAYTKVLHGDTNENYMGEKDLGWFCGIGFGVRTNSMAGFPHFKDVTFKGTFPLANVTFKEEGFPCIVRLCAFNPFIPQDEDSSSLPCAIFKWEIENTTDEEVEYSIAFTVQNPSPVSINRQIKGDGYKGVFLKNGEKDELSVDYFDISVITSGIDTVVQENWYRGGWQDGVTTYWKNLCECHRLPKRSYEKSGNHDHATVASYIKIAPGEKREIPFVLSWNCPNNYNYWSEYKDEKGNHKTWKNYYATRFENSQVSGAYAFNELDNYYKVTKNFCDALQGMSLDEAIIDAISANLSVIKTPVVLRLEDGSIWGWEGLHQTKGSCDGSCQHVWNYAYAIPYLFPRLERSLRENTLKYATKENGQTAFRLALPLGREPNWWRACVDGQMGEVIKFYREWKICGDSLWLKANIDKIFKIVEYAWSPENPDGWDRDKDGVLEGRQHHTLDMELFGASSWLQGLYLLALDCVSQLALECGYLEKAQEYKEIYEKGKKWTNENLFNGRYFYHRINLKDKSIIDKYPETESYWNAEAEEIKYQVANGCIIDQMLGDFHAYLIGCEGVFENGKKQVALDYLYENNFKSSMREVTNMWRNFSLNDEGGALICTYPENEKAPAIPIPYCEETMTGFEYALAGLMIANGQVERGEKIVKAIRQRYDGEKRNPWNEIECGSNYARSMASFALLNIYSGFSCDLPRSFMGFYKTKNGKFLWSGGNTWGTVHYGKKKCKITVLGKKLTVKNVGVSNPQNVKNIKIDGALANYECHDEYITISTPIEKSMEIEYNL